MLQAYTVKNISHFFFSMKYFCMDLFFSIVFSFIMLLCVLRFIKPLIKIAGQQLQQLVYSYDKQVFLFR